ncbi:hypothetical protein Taro_039099 [Colocasia esculenta]|uniref:Uncharacterized protein n=1 Tax=Colocasia esculenta TaxID=4460 RepID=A0A843WFN5_COLES|nr:hypothetical protein [Colocasia esculenta]
MELGCCAPAERARSLMRCAAGASGAWASGAWAMEADGWAGEMEFVIIVLDFFFFAVSCWLGRSKSDPVEVVISNFFCVLRTAVRRTIAGDFFFSSGASGEDDLGGVFEGSRRRLRPEGFWKPIDSLLMVSWVGCGRRPLMDSDALIRHFLCEENALFLAIDEAIANEDVIGAIDGTFIPTHILRERQARHRNRKGVVSQNVMAVCGFDLVFQYVGVGFEGAAADMTVLRRALDEGGFSVPKGKYYLVDSGRELGDDFYFNLINEVEDNNVDPEEDPHLQLSVNEFNPLAAWFKGRHLSILNDLVNLFKDWGSV